MALEDLALFRSLPNSVVFYPSDAVSAENAVLLAYNHESLCYIRTSRPDTAILYKNDEKFEIGKAKIVKAAKEANLILASSGVTLFEAIKAAELLETEGVHCSVIDLFTIKPLDKETLETQALGSSEKRIVTIEDHYLQGGIFGIYFLIRIGLFSFKRKQLD